ncbi:MAG: tRNA (N6-threonylcarbamoyladenosine(37)-N6)-methyltransferase TrmO [Thiotrichales bacterium]|nr:tRNA (N6-threonylcarbamoyladenosine(37)-N6)-methyltransferase TrmO [Thiotrichales bacterium]
MPITPPNLPFHFETIGLIHSPFTDKFGMPRQTGLLEGAEGWIELLPPWNRQEALQGLNGFSHLWVVFVFHQATRDPANWRPTVRPPRLGAKRQGVFATRSPYRPNPIGISLLTYHGWQYKAGKLCLRVGGLDLLDQTPVLDIKPYVPYADCRPEARGGFAEQAPQSDELPVKFSPLAEQQLNHAAIDYPNLDRLIRSTLRHNLRPAYFGHIQQRQAFGLKLYHFNIQWQLHADWIEVHSLIPPAQKPTP